MPREKAICLLTLLEQAICIDLKTLSGLPDAPADRASSLTRVHDYLDGLLRSTQEESRGLPCPIDAPLPPEGGSPQRADDDEIPW